MLNAAKWLKMNIEIALTDKQSELDASLEQYDITGYGGAKGGGKSHGARSVLLLRTLTKPGHVGALFRRTYPELEENHIGPLFRQFPELRGYYNSGRREIRIPALESEFKFRFCERQSDVDKYAGREYHTLGIEEAGDWPLDMAFKLIRNCNRSTAKNIKAAAMLTFNWGGIGHGGLKRIFVTRDLHIHEKKLTFNFIPAKIEDNPAILENDPGYLIRLESEPNEALRRAYRWGDSDIIAGQYFDLQREIHVVRPFAIPKYWTWFGAYDYGYNHPAAWGIFAVDSDGKVFLVHEIIQAKMGIPEQAIAINEYLETQGKPEIIFQAGHDCWAKRKANDPTIAEDFGDASVVGQGNEIQLVQAKIDRLLGAYRVRQYLKFHSVNGKQTGPNFYIFENCKYTIECLTRMVHDPKRVEDVLKTDSSNSDPLSGDDPYDMVRYGLMSRPSLNPGVIPEPKRGDDGYKELEQRKMEEAAIERLERELNPHGWPVDLGEGF